MNLTRVILETRTRSQPSIRRERGWGGRAPARGPADALRAYFTSGTVELFVPREGRHAPGYASVYWKRPVSGLNGRTDCARPPGMPSL
jgi:hypothetical protein